MGKAKNNKKNKKDKNFLKKEKKSWSWNFSLRSKLVIAFAIVVASISTLIVYFSIEMIYEDKKSYLYEAVLKEAKNSTVILDRYFESKLNQTQALFAYIKMGGDPERFLTKEKDLFQVKKFLKQPSGSYTFVNDIYVNEEYLKKYKKRQDFLKSDISVFKGLFSDKDQVSFKVLYELNKAPKLSFGYKDSKQNYYVFVFLLDNILGTTLNGSGFDLAFVKKDSKTSDIVYYNNPYKLNQVKREAILGITKKVESSKRLISGVREEVIGESSYMLAYEGLNSLNGYYIFSLIKSDVAFEVTKVIVLRTILYMFGFIGIFNIASLGIARTITSPLKKLLEGIENVSSGNFKARIDLKSKDEFREVATAFNDMALEIEEYNEKLKEANRTLEDKVVERTLELRKANDFIKATIDSLGQGLLVFNQEGRCFDTYTKACEKLLGTSPFRKNIKDILSPPDSKVFDDWIKSLYEELIPFQSLSKLGPQSITKGENYKALNFKHIGLEYFPMRDEENKVSNIVMVATDKTKEFKAGKELQEQKDHIKLVGKVIKNKKSFFDFMDDFEKSLETINFENIKEKKDDLMLLLHSLKGGVAMYSMSDLAEQLHQLETDVEEAQKGSDDLLTQSKKILKLGQKKKAKILELFGENPEDDNANVSAEEVQKFYNYLVENDLKEIAQEFKVQFSFESVESYIGPYIQLVQDLSADLGKEIAPLEIVNADLKVHPTAYKDFFTSCVHIFRNSVDHGIEAPSKREELGKNRAGKIKISFQAPTGNNGLWVFQVQDDGGGINPERIREKMKSLGYPEETLSKKDEQIIYHIFDSSFSTSDEVNEISGRGVGLHDVQLAIKKLGGEIVLQSKEGMGTIFSFYLPFIVES